MRYKPLIFGTVISAVIAGGHGRQIVVLYSASVVSGQTTVAISDGVHIRSAAFRGQRAAQISYVFSSAC
jgi:hypothetical protein